MKELERISLNTTMVVGVTDHKIFVRIYEEELKIAFNEVERIPNMEDVLQSFKGKRACMISSDITGEMNKKIKVKVLEKHVVSRIQKEVLAAYLPYLATIAKNENSEILIQSSNTADNPRLTITAGLIDDIQVILLDIHYERNERRI